MEKFIAWIDAEIKKADSEINKDLTFSIQAGYFARKRKMKFAKEVFMEYEKNILKKS